MTKDTEDTEDTLDKFATKKPERPEMTIKEAIQILIDLVSKRPGPSSTLTETRIAATSNKHLISGALCIDPTNSSERIPADNMIARLLDEEYIVARDGNFHFTEKCETLLVNNENTGDTQWTKENRT